MIQSKKIHFVSVGGSLMHSLAIALKTGGHHISGSDDEIYEPSKSNLERHDLLPAKEGWHPDRITPDLDAIIVGMHAKSDNPELKKAKELNIKIYSAPEYIYEQSEDKQRVVIAGSHGKTTIVSILMHILKFHGRKFDYACGARISGFENMVQLSDAPIIVIEGDEYSSSPFDPTPKMMKYQHHVGLISGIAWDHINVFPDEDEYVKQFDIFADTTPKGGTLVYCEEDPLAAVIGGKQRQDVHQMSYETHAFVVEDGKSFLLWNDQRVPVNIFGRHNMQNLNGARQALKRLSVADEDFYAAVTSFEGAALRLQLISANETSALYRDYAHAPSKVQASTMALKEQFPERELVACLELHTFSSLNKEFLPTYRGTLKYANYPIVYYNPKTVASKNMPTLSEDEVAQAFGGRNIKVFSDAQKLQEWISDQHWENKNLVMMSSGTFGNVDFGQLSKTISS